MTTNRILVAVAFPIAAMIAIAPISGCTSLLGGPKQATTIFDPEVRVQTQGERWPMVDWQLAIARVTGDRSVDGLRIQVRPTPNELQVYKGARWAKPPADMLEEGILHALEDSGQIGVVARQGSGLGSEYRLLLDVRRFESDYSGAPVPSATVEVTTKLLHVKSQQLAGSHTFLYRQVARTSAVPDVVGAFQRVLQDASKEIAGWTLQTGQAHAREARLSR